MRERIYLQGAATWRDLGAGNSIEEGRVEVRGHVIEAAPGPYDQHRARVRAAKARRKAAGEAGA